MTGRLESLTRAGMIKGGDRHEKDDRNNLNDRSRFVLGWSNKPKIAVLDAKKRTLETSLGDVGAELSQTQIHRRQLRSELDAHVALQEMSDFRELDWRTCSNEVARLKSEKEQLEGSSDTLRELTAQLERALRELKESEGMLSELDKELGKVEEKIATNKTQREQTEALAGAIVGELRVALEGLRSEVLAEHQLTVESCDNREREMRDVLQTRIDNDGKRLERLHEKIIKTMSQFKEIYKLDTSEFDASIDAAFEYRKLLDQVRSDDLPRFERSFKKLLNENTIHEIASFNAQLNKAREDISDRIQSINQSLTEIEYNSSRYITLQHEQSLDAEIRDFRQDLRACTEGHLTGSEDTQYSEAKFLQVKAIIDRFRGREGLVDMDKRWTEKVTDVRNWFLFAASERWREDHVEFEHYSDSGGKSGGQKEKLAYTILAASLAYQFGLKQGEVRSRSFRFVVIDEAFGRGSDESANYGLELFRKLNLQLLIVTPLQKTHIIEPFVANVGFVENKEGRASTVLNLSIEEHLRQKAEWHS